MSSAETPGTSGEPTEEQLRAAYEDQMKRIRVENLILEQAVTLLDFGMRRTGLAPGTEDERDPDQVRLAVEGIRALMPLVEGLVGAQQLAGFRDALSRLQMEYVRMGGSVAGADSGAAAGGPAPAGAGGPGSPAQAGQSQNDPAGPGGAKATSRLWIPGQ